MERRDFLKGLVAAPVGALLFRFKKPKNVTSKTDNSISWDSPSGDEDIGYYEIQFIGKSGITKRVKTKDRRVVLPFPKGEQFKFRLRAVSHPHKHKSAWSKS